MDALLPAPSKALAGRVAAVINTASGAAKPGSADELAAILAAAGLSGAEIVQAAPPQIAEVRARTSAASDVLVVLGGDGTIRSAAAACAPCVNFLGPLPGGTVNMLPKALYGDRPWPEILADVVARPQGREVSGGLAGEEAFFVAALVGAPTLWADVREAIRLGKIAEAARRAATAARRSFSEPLHYAFGAVTGAAEAVAVVCPLISKALPEDEPALEAAAIDPETATQALRLGFHALFDDWRADPSVVRTKSRRIELVGRGPLPVMLDGEKIRMGRKVEIRFTPTAFRALVPA